MPHYFVDLFAGAGGFTQGLRDAGFDHLVGVELDPLVAKTYALNHGHVIVKDARELQLVDLAPYLGNKRVTLLAASPPCTSFSTAGLRAPGDARDTLYKEVVRVARMLHPRWVVIENVVGMLSKSIDQERAIDRMLGELASAGYHAEYRVLNANEYGVPQKRRRVIIVAAVDPADVRFPLPVPGYDAAVGPHLLPADEVDPKYFASPTQIAYFARKPKYCRVLDESKPCLTLRASYCKNAGSDAIIRYAPDRMRRLTEGEAAAIQTFPPTYLFEGAMTRVYMQIGNAIPPRLAEHVGRALLAAYRAR